MSQGYMLVRYSRYTLPNECEGEEHLASGRRIHIRPKGQEINALLKGYYDDVKSNPAFTIVKKDLRSGWFIYKTNGAILMLAKMPFSNRKIAGIML